MNQLTLTWNYKYPQQVYYGLNTVDLNSPHFDNLQGVYVIWIYQQNLTPIAIYTGQGRNTRDQDGIKERIRFHRGNPRVQQYKTSGTLYVAWAEVTPIDMNGVERYLYNRLKPLATIQAPNVEPILVNIPPPWTTL